MFTELLSYHYVKITSFRRFSWFKPMRSSHSMFIIIVADSSINIISIGHHILQRIEYVFWFRFCYDMLIILQYQLSFCNYIFRFKKDSRLCWMDIICYKKLAKCLFKFRFLSLLSITWSQNSYVISLLFIVLINRGKKYWKRKIHVLKKSTMEPNYFFTLISLL